LYRRFSDNTFNYEIPRNSEEEHMGFLGPVLRASVGDVMTVYFNNKCSQPYSMHPHGVFYDKNSEGATYNDGTNSSSGHVEPNQTWQYTWQVTDNAGPGPNDGSSLIWPYHSHNHEVADPAAGLIGMIVVCAQGNNCNENNGNSGRPSGIDREFFLLFYVMNENFSPLLNRNIQLYTGDGQVPDLGDEGFVESNLMHAINGYVYGNQPMMTVYAGENVRWYIMAMGNENDLHNVHWHAETLLLNGHRVDTVSLVAAQWATLDMKVQDNEGIWLLHCHVDDHMLGGMMTRYTIANGDAKSNKSIIILS